MDTVYVHAMDTVYVVTYRRIYGMAGSIRAQAGVMINDI